MKESIDWEAPALRLGTSREGGESGGSQQAREAPEVLLGEGNLRGAVDYYISGRPGGELARSVLWYVRPGSAMRCCYEIYKSEAPLEVRRSAVELLRVVADGRAVDWVDEFLDDEDAVIQSWGAGVLDQLTSSGLVDVGDVEHLILKAEAHANPNVRDRAGAIRELFNRDEGVRRAGRAAGEGET